MRTSDGGASWVGLPAPKDVLATSEQPGAVGVTEVRFADPADGWVFGPDLWATHNGGATWNRLNLGAGSETVALAASDGFVYAIVTHPCSSSAGACPASLYSSAASSNSFAPVSAVSLPNGANGETALALHGHTGYIVVPPGPTGNIGGGSLWRTLDGVRWTLTTSPCGSKLSPDTISPLTDNLAILLCAGQGAAGSSQKAIYRSTDAGATWSAATAPKFSEGDGGDVSASSPSVLSVATFSAASEIYRSTDGGVSFTTSLQIADGGIGWGDFGFKTPTQGIAIHAPAARTQQGGYQSPYPATLFITRDSGATWKPTTF